MGAVKGMGRSQGNGSSQWNREQSREWGAVKETGTSQGNDRRANQEMLSSRVGRTELIFPTYLVFKKNIKLNNILLF